MTRAVLLPFGHPSPPFAPSLVAVDACLLGKAWEVPTKARFSQFEWRDATGPDAVCLPEWLPLRLHCVFSLVWMGGRMVFGVLFGFGPFVWVFVWGLVWAVSVLAWFFVNQLSNFFLINGRARFFFVFKRSYLFDISAGFLLVAIMNCLSCTVVATARVIKSFQ
jgi:hypothetical protein